MRLQKKGDTSPNFLGEALRNYMVAREMPRPCATLCRGRPWWHKVPRHKVTRHKVTRHKVLAQGCRHKALAPSHEHISWPRTKFMKTMTAHAFHMILMPAALFPPIPETMKMMTVPGISCDSEANRSRRRAGGRGKGEGGWRVAVYGYPGIFKGLPRQDPQNHFFLK